MQNRAFGEVLLGMMRSLKGEFVDGPINVVAELVFETGVVDSDRVLMGMEGVCCRKQKSNATIEEKPRRVRAAASHNRI